MFCELLDRFVRAKIKLPNFRYPSTTCSLFNGFLGGLPFVEVTDSQDDFCGIEAGPMNIEIDSA